YENMNNLYQRIWAYSESNFTFDLSFDLFQGKLYSSAYISSWEVHTSQHEHYKHCLLVKAKCPSDGCNVKMLKQNLGQHIKEECQFKKQPQPIMEIGDAQLADVVEEITMLEITSYDGTYFWAIENYERRLQDAVAGRSLFINSPPFYMCQFGYKVRARVYLNGDGMGKGTHLSLFFVVMRGAYDALLPWPFQQKVSFKLINQTGGQHVIDSFRPDPNSSSFQRPTSNMNIASGCPLFVPKSMVHSRGHIKDGTVFIKIAVETNGLPIY
ncbi:TNF receptor-associated factor 3, partial, partial [Paramuricea clavata]